MKKIVHIATISEIHEILGMEKPRHPLVSVLPIDERITGFDYGESTYVFDFYQVSLKSGIKGSFTYGRNTYDFQEGSMVFTKPSQAQSYTGSEDTGEEQGWVLLFHPDLIRRSTLNKRMDQYNYFSYEVSEALHVSDEEKRTLSDLVEKIRAEYCQNIDRHTQNLIVSNIELLLDYCVRFYDRQFYVRTNMNQDVVTRFESLLEDYFRSEKPLEMGMPTVNYCGEQLNMSAHYLSDLLKKESGKSARQHIQAITLERAKDLLLGSNEQVSQIAYTLGFEYPQHFSKFFKAQTGMSPKEYRSIS